MSEETFPRVSPGERLAADLVNRHSTALERHDRLKGGGGLSSRQSATGQAIVDDRPDKFLAQLTGKTSVSGIRRFSWSERVRLDDGSVATPLQARSGDSSFAPAFERNNQDVTLLNYVELTPCAAGTYFEFDAPAAASAPASVLEATSYQTGTVNLLRQFLGKGTKTVDALAVAVAHPANVGPGGDAVPPNEGGDRDAVFTVTGGVGTARTTVVLANRNPAAWGGANLAVGDTFTFGDVSLYTSAGPTASRQAWITTTFAPLDGYGFTFWSTLPSGSSTGGDPLTDYSLTLLRYPAAYAGLLSSSSLGFASRKVLFAPGNIECHAGYWMGGTQGYTGTINGARFKGGICTGPA